jgi:rhodanese-related sulfurtransferase/glutaredoxin-related protein
MKKILIALFINLILLTTVFAQETSPALLSVDSFATKISRQSKPQIIDVRTPEEFSINHINGAIYINLKEESHLKASENFDKAKPVFIYAIQNSRPDILAKELREKGYTNVYELKGGIASWIGGGYPYYTSLTNTISLTDYKKTIADNKVVIVEIGTKFCGLCTKAKVILDSLQREHNSSYKILEIELYNNPQLVAELKEVTAVPTIILYKEGKIAWKKTGLVFNKDDIKVEIAKAQ